MEQLILFIKNLWTETIAPSMKVLSDKQSQNSEKIVKAIKEKKNATDISINNPEDVSNPIVEAQNSTTQAIKDIPSVNIPEVDLSSLESKLEALLLALKDKDLSVKIGKTKVDTKSVVKAIQKLEKNLPELTVPEQIDYTLMLDEIMKIMEEPKYTADILRIQDSLDRLATSKDMSSLAEYLQAIIDKPYQEQPPFEFKDGRLKVSVDKAGGGGGVAEPTISAVKNLAGNKVPAATEEKQDDIIAGQTNTLDNYKASDEENTADYDYYGYLDKDGGWIIEQIDNSTLAHRYIKGDSDYTTNWTNRASLTYQLFNVIF